MESLTQCAWVWVSSRSWWWTGRPGMLESMWLQRVGDNWETEMNWSELMGLDAVILVFWMLSFKPTFSLSSFTFIKRLFSSFSLSAIRMVSYAYLRLLIFFLAILIPACASASQAFHTMYFAYKLIKRGDNIQPWHTSSPIWNQSVVPCPVLTFFLTCIQISQEARNVVWYSHLFKDFPQCVVIHTVKGFGVVNKAEFLELSFSTIQQMLAIWSLVPVLFLKPAWTSGSSQLTSCWSQAWRFWALLC